jgi:HTH-type transcriptional regulator/antitoxin HigA
MRPAREALVPIETWQAMPNDLGTEKLLAIAAKAGVHPAIVAGRWRYEHQDYRRFSKLIGRGEVRCYFCE